MKSSLLISIVNLPRTFNSKFPFKCVLKYNPTVYTFIIIIFFIFKCFYTVSLSLFESSVCWICNLQVSWNRYKNSAIFPRMEKGESYTNRNVSIVAIVEITSHSMQKKLNLHSNLNPSRRINSSHRLMKPIKTVATQNGPIKCGIVDLSLSEPSILDTFAARLSLLSRFALAPSLLHLTISIHSERDRVNAAEQERRRETTVSCWYPGYQ